MNNLVEVFTKKNCIHCIQLKSWFKKNEISYVEKDISNRENFDELEAYGQSNIPFVVVQNNNQTETVLGLNKKKLRRILSIV